MLKYLRTMCALVAAALSVGCGNDDSRDRYEHAVVSTSPAAGESASAPASSTAGPAAGGYARLFPGRWMARDGATEIQIEFNAGLCRWQVTDEGTVQQDGGPYAFDPVTCMLTIRGKGDGTVTFKVHMPDIDSMELTGEDSEYLKLVRQTPSPPNAPGD